MSGFMTRLAENIAAAGRAFKGRDLGQRKKSFFLHPNPSRVSRVAISPWATLGLGLMTLSLFAVLTVTGLLLMFYYVPTVEQALSSTNDLEFAVAFGSVVRAAHRWAGHAMVGVVFLHMFRVLFTAGYANRGLNWLVGMAGLGLTLALAFTGYLLPWDQLSFWAVRVGTNIMDQVPVAGGWLKTLMLGGDEVGQAALTRFYMLHVCLLPLSLVLVVLWHIWRMRKDGGLACTEEARNAGDLSTLPASPHLTYRQGAIFSFVAALVLFAAVLFPAPLGPAADAHNPSNPEKTTWYFLWLQEMVSYSAMVGGLVFPAMAGVLLASVPMLDRKPERMGAWLGSRSEKIAFLAASIVSVIIFVCVEYWFLSNASERVTDWFNPASIMMLCIAVAFVAAGIATGSTRAAVQSAAIVLFVSIIGFTVIGVLRGPDWRFFWPGEEWPIVR